MEERGDLEPVQVARVGKALYLLDGFHRVDAAGELGWTHISARIAKMNLPEALTYSEASNTRHGKGPNRDDKAKRWDAYVARGGHLNERGERKTYKAIAAEVEVYTPPTVLKKLKALELLNASGELETWGSGEGNGNWGRDGEDDEGDYLDEVGGPEDPLEAERNEEALGHLEGLTGLFDSLNGDHQETILERLRELGERIGRGELAVPVEAERTPLDI